MGDPDLLPEALRVFETVSPGSKIEVIRLHAHFDGLWQPEFDEKSLGYQHWRSLDALLSNRERFGRLRKLELDVHANNMKLDESIAERIGNYLKKLKSLGILDLKPRCGYLS